MKVLDLFAGLGGWGMPFKDRGHEVFSIDFNPRFNVNLVKNILDVKASDIPWTPDIILASPPCEGFSLLRANINWDNDKPITIRSKMGMKILQKTLNLIEELKPKYFIIENPRAKMRATAEVQPFERRTVTYCQYGMKWMKPTDLWGGFPPSLKLKPVCFKGATCHEYVSPGCGKGIVGCHSSAERAEIPYALALEVCLATEVALSGYENLKTNL